MSLRRIAIALLFLPLAACSSLRDKVVQGNSLDTSLYETVKVEQGLASWYKDKRTASGERFDIKALTAAHKKLPFGTKVRVVDLKTSKSVVVRINDRGPYIRGRVIDLTIGAARQLGMYDRGIAKVRLEVLKEIPLMKKPNLRLKSIASQRSREEAVSENAPNRTASR